MAESFRPETAEQVREAVAWAAAEEEPLELLGRGSKRSLGRPVQAGRSLDLSQLSGIRLYEPDEVYDRAADPYETINLADVPDHREVVAGLRTSLLEWLAETSDVIPWEQDPRTPDTPQGWR